MGFNISGLAIDTSYENKLDQLQNDLNLTFEFIEDVNFETASSNWTDEGTAYIHFAGNSTLVFLPMDMCVDPFPIENKKTLTFALSETSMAFNLHYYEGKSVVRSIMEYNGEIMDQVGEPFEFEAQYGDSSETIWTLLDEVLDVSYHSIDLSESAKKYKVSYGRPIVEESLNENLNSPEIGSKEHQAELEKKYSSFSNDQLQQEFQRIINIPNARTNIQCLVETAALMKITKERGIDLQKPAKEAKKDKMGCMPMLVFGFLFASGLTTYFFL